MYVIGTAGHVDHGKSTLIKALTGIDPDRLQEEKEREMTIDLGFAWLTLPSGREVSVVDVPGHERFIKNMLAGIGGINLALLVVAADEGVMPQTLEHLAILDLLQVPRGLVVLTKRDLVDDEWLEMVSGEVADVLRGTTLESAEVMPVSATTGEGLGELKSAIDMILKVTSFTKDLGRPRLPVDRSFTMVGFGTVVTGTLTGGALIPGQEVELMPSEQRARIRGVESHSRRVERAEPGTRVAINLTGIGHNDILRGEVLTTRGSLRPTSILDVQIRVPRWAPSPVKHNLSLSFHTGTSETRARVRLLNADTLSPGQEGWAQVHLEEPIAVVSGDYFIVRSPQWTLGGGIIVDTTPRRHRRFQQDILDRLRVMAEGVPREAMLAALENHQPTQMRELVSRANFSEDEAQQEIESMIAVGDVVAVGEGLREGRIMPDTYLFTADEWKRQKKLVTEVLQTYHGLYPLRRGMAREELRSRMRLRGNIFVRVLPLLVAEGVVLEKDTLVHTPDHVPGLTSDQEKRAMAYIASLESQPYSPPTGAPPEHEILDFLVENGRVVRANSSVVFAAGVYEEMLRRVKLHLRENGTITVGEMRDLFGTSRKYTLALLEYFDQCHITRRIGDERVLARD